MVGSFAIVILVKLKVLSPHQLHDQHLQLYLHHPSHLLLEAPRLTKISHSHSHNHGYDLTHTHTHNHGYICFQCLVAQLLWQIVPTLHQVNINKPLVYHFL